MWQARVRSTLKIPAVPSASPKSCASGQKDAIVEDYNVSNDFALVVPLTVGEVEAIDVYLGSLLDQLLASCDGWQEEQVGEMSDDRD
jgi:hypothetical protein